ncbi:MAG: methyltransferase domain-containing protein [Planctomycetota bacterium]
MSTDSDLAAHRQHAAELSKGISGSGVRRLALRLVQPHGGEAKLLDFGAGTGDLLRDLHGRGWFRQLAGADILTRPDDLPTEIGWLQLDLNETLDEADRFDVVLSTEVIEHLENPRAMMRQLFGLLKPGGKLVLTTPNQESYRSLLSLVLSGHYAAFRGASYPAHITALLRLDLERIAKEAGFEQIEFHPSGHGLLPKLCRWSWQQVSLGVLRGLRFSDNIGMTAVRPAG